MIDIRPARGNDAASVAAIYAPYVKDSAISFEIEAPNAPIMAMRIAKTLETHPWLVAVSGGTVVGFAYAGQHRERPGYRWTVETTVYVDASACRRGIGRALYRTLLRMLREQGFRSAFAGIVLPNPRSARLHAASGFKPIGVHENVGFKLGRWHDIGYWCVDLADKNGPPREPIPFAVFKDTPAFATALGTKNASAELAS